MLYKTEFGLEKRVHILPAIIAGASALGSLGVGIYNSIAGNKANSENLRLQRETNQQNLAMQQYTLALNKQAADRDFEYNKQLQERIFQREDSAVQRMVADNRAAGLSPIAGLSGAGTGQALEANTAYVSAPQSIPAPQMSANQLSVDFSSLGALANTIQRENEHKDSLELEQNRLDLQKSSNEENIRLMKSQIEASDIKNEIARATMQDEIEGSKLKNENVRSVINKNLAEIATRALDNSIKELSKVQTEREMQEWLDNKQIRADLSRYSLDEQKERALALELTNQKNSSAYGTQLDILSEELAKIRRENQSAEDTAKAWASVEESLNLKSGEGKLTINFLKWFAESFMKAALH